MYFSLSSFRRSLVAFTEQPYLVVCTIVGVAALQEAPHDAGADARALADGVSVEALLPYKSPDIVPSGRRFPLVVFLVFFLGYPSHGRNINPFRVVSFELSNSSHILPPEDEHCGIASVFVGASLPPRNLGEGIGW